MADDLIAYVGDSLRIRHVATGDVAFSIATVAINIYDSAGTAVVSAGAGAADTGPATELAYWYDWTTATAGDYTYRLKRTVEGRTESVGGTIIVWPLFSKLDTYIERIKGLVQETAVGEEQSSLSLRDYRDALLTAVRVYERTRPREIQKDVSLTASVWEYDLTTLASGISPTAVWINDYSEILRVEPDVDDTQQSRYWSGVLMVSVDERRAKWRLEDRSPSAGEIARVTWTTRHTLSHTVDTLPEADRESLCLYAAGEAMVQLANQSVRTDAPQVAGDVVNYRDRQLRYRQQAADAMTRAKALWAVPTSERVWLGSGGECRDRFVCYRHNTQIRAHNCGNRPMIELQIDGLKSLDTFRRRLVQDAGRIVNEELRRAIEDVRPIVHAEVLKRTPVGIIDPDAGARRRLKDTLFTRVEGSGAFVRLRVGFTAPHARFVDADTRPHVIRPRHRRVLRFAVGGRTVFARQVRHPGTQGQHMLERGLAAARPRMQNVFRARLAVATRRIARG